MVIKLCFMILLMQNQSMMYKKRDQLFYLESNMPQIIRDLTSKLMIPEFKKSQITRLIQK